MALPRLGTVTLTPENIGLQNGSHCFTNPLFVLCLRSDYIPVNEVVVFGPYSRTREVAVEIVDDNQWEPDEEFFLRLSIVEEDFERDDVALGRQSIMEIVILDDDGMKHWLLSKS